MRIVGHSIVRIPNSSIGQGAFMTRWLIAAVGTLAFAGAAHADPGLADLVQNGQDAAALKMIEAGANVNVPQDDGTTALDWATYRLDIPMVHALLQHGANPNLMNSLGSCPLEEAVKAANFDLVRMLLKAGAYADEANADGETPLMLAAHTGVVKIAELLVSYGANVNAREKWRGQTALMWAAAQDHPEMTRLLLRHGAKVNVREDYNDWLDRATQITSEPRAQYRPEGGLTALLYAARSGCLDCVKALLKAGADVNKPTPDAVTPLMSAIDNYRYDIAIYLVKHGANPNTWDWSGRTALYCAVDMHTYGVNTGVRGRFGAPPQPAAALATDLELIKLLLAKGVNPNAQLDLHRPSRGGNSGRFTDDLERTGATPLLRAAMSHDNVVIELLLKHGALVDLPNVNGVTPLITAAGMGLEGGPGTIVPDMRGDFSRGMQQRAISTIAILLKAGANINARVTDTSSLTARIARSSTMTDRQGETALYGAIYRGWPLVVRYLLQHGAKVHVVDDKGRSPLVAATKGVGSRYFKPVKQVIALITAATANEPLTSSRTPAPSLRSATLRTTVAATP
jgi:uncharacterized protein